MKKWLKHNNGHLWVVALTAALILVLGLLTFHLPLLKPVGTAMKNLSLLDIFYRVERDWFHTATVNENITLVNMRQLTDRGDIARLLQDIYDLQPLAMGVDLHFDREKDPAGDQLLRQVADEVADVTVFASELPTYDEQAQAFTEVANSFFVTDRLMHGYTNLTDDMAGRPIRTYTVSQQVNGNREWSFAAALANSLGCPLPQNREYTIDYGTTDFPIVDCSAVDASADDLTGHIVLVGLYDDPADSHPTPVGKLSGMVIHAYSLDTLMRHHDVLTVASPWSWLIAAVVAWLVELSLCWCRDTVANRTVARNVFLADSRLLITLADLGWSVLLTAVAFILFRWANTYVDILPSLLVIALLPYAHRVYYAARNARSLPKQDKKH